jgi:hypothetical protein
VTLRNIVQAGSRPNRWLADGLAWEQYRHTLVGLKNPRLSDAYDELPIPKLLHFVHLYPAGDLSYLAYIAIRSAKFRNPGWLVLLHCYVAPSGPLADSLRDDLQLVFVPFISFFGVARLHHPAHKSDIDRLMALSVLGGLYLDLDTICVRSFDALRAHKTVMGVQAATESSPVRFCNATLLSAPGSEFIGRWLRAYRFFRSRGPDDELWDVHSTAIPLRIYSERPTLLVVLPHDAFFFPLWHDVARFLLAESSADFAIYHTSAYSYHLWNQEARSHLSVINDDWVRRSKSLYARFARDALGITSDITCREDAMHCGT